MIIKAIEDIYTQYNFPESFKTTMLNVFEKLQEEEIQNVLSCYESPETLEFERMGAYLQTLSEKYSVPRFTLNLFAVVILSPRVRTFYQRAGVAENVIKDTLADILYKYIECKRVYNIDGIKAWDWYLGLFKLNLFQIGRLQYKYAQFLFLDEYEKDGKIIRKDEEVIGIHIPTTGTPLAHEACLESYQKAEQFFKEFFVGRQLTFTCCSWLLNPENEEIMDKNSNIVRFMKDFDVIYKETYDNYEKFAPWIFGKEKLENFEIQETDTSLQRQMKKHLASGGKISVGYGVRFV